MTTGQPFVENQPSNKFEVGNWIGNYGDLYIYSILLKFWNHSSMVLDFIIYLIVVFNVRTVGTSLLKVVEDSKWGHWDTADYGLLMYGNFMDCCRMEWDIWLFNPARMKPTVYA